MDYDVTKGQVVRYFCDGSPRDGFAAIVATVHEDTEDTLTVKVLDPTNERYETCRHEGDKKWMFPPGSGLNVT